MLPYQERVREEHKELSEKCTSLHNFVGGPIFSRLPKEEQFRLRLQLQAMQLYSGILAERISNF